MDLWDLLRVLVRRWWVTIPLLALTTVAAITLGARETTTYEGTASYLLVGPANDGTNGLPAVNPIASLSSTGQFAGLLGTVVGSTQTRDAVEQAGGSPDYQLTQNRGAPTLVVAVETDTAYRAEQTVKTVVAEVEQQVRTLQQKIAVPAQFRIRGQLVVPPIVTATAAGSTRVLLAVAAAGLLITALAALAVEALLSTRRREAVPTTDGAVRSLTRSHDDRLPATQAEDGGRASGSGS